MERECYLCGKEIKGKAFRFFDKTFNEYIYACSEECFKKINEIIEEESREHTKSYT